MMDPWWGPTNTIHHSVGIDEVLVIFKGGGDTLNYNTDFHNADFQAAYSMVWRRGGSAPFEPPMYILLQSARFPDSIFRWFKFTLKLPYSRAHERSLLAIFDTSHWNFFVKFGLWTA